MANSHFDSLSISFADFRSSSASVNRSINSGQSRAGLSISGIRQPKMRNKLFAAVKAKKKQRAPLLPIHGARGVAFAETLERQCSPVYEDADDASPAILPIPMEASGRGHEPQARAVRQLAAELPTYQSLPGQG
ncbi:hypothetical protein Trydic_g10075, partial [Trypoxylus dichotomus]